MHAKFHKERLSQVIYAYRIKQEILKHNLCPRVYRPIIRENPDSGVEHVSSGFND